MICWFEAFYCQTPLSRSTRFACARPLQVTRKSKVSITMQCSRTMRDMYNLVFPCTDLHRESGRRIQEATAKQTVPRLFHNSETSKVRLTESGADLFEVVNKVQVACPFIKAKTFFANICSFIFFTVSFPEASLLKQRHVSCFHHRSRSREHR